MVLSLGEKILKFDNLPEEEQTVSTFNNLFPALPRYVALDLRLRIGELYKADLRKIIIDDGTTIVHNMVRDIPKDYSESSSNVSV